MELRCEHGKLHGIVEGGIIEVKCRCQEANEKHMVILHRFNVRTGKLIETKKYKEPLGGE